MTPTTVYLVISDEDHHTARGAAARGLEGETGIRVDPDDLTLVGDAFVDFGEDGALVSVNYAAPRGVASGTVETATDGADARFWSREEILTDPPLARASGTDQLLDAVDRFGTGDRNRSVVVLPGGTDRDYGFFTRAPEETRMDAEIVENTLDVDVEEFLARPLFCFLGTVSADGDPRVTPLWFLWEDGAVWMIANAEKTYPERVDRHPESDLAVVDFDRTTGRVQHVGMRGRATVEPHDPERAIRLLTPYLGPDMDEWDQSRFPDPREWGEEMVLIRFEPDTVVARDQSYAPTPSVRDGSG